MSDDNSISEEELDSRYREIVDSFIDQANELAGHNSIENVGMAMLFAASRFNAYVVSQHADNKEKYKADRPKAQSFFMSQYKDMLDENLEDYEEVFQKYHEFTKPR
ncbi:MAG: hypothetical protein ACI845_002562 [Gammaproteobacteria bacterium]|jgi:hypothetical protein